MYVTLQYLKPKRYLSGKAENNKKEDTHTPPTSSVQVLVQVKL